MELGRFSEKDSWELQLPLEKVVCAVSEGNRSRSAEGCCVWVGLEGSAVTTRAFQRNHEHFIVTKGGKSKRFLQCM